MKREKTLRNKDEKELRKISCALLLRSVEVGEEVLFENLDKTEVKLKVVEQEDCDGCYFSGRCRGIPCRTRKFSNNPIIFKEVKE